MRARLTFALVGLAGTALAQTSLPTTPPSDGSGIERLSTGGYWESGVGRPFVAGSLELGWTYVRPRIAAGYGRPYYRWLGVEAAPLGSTSGAGAYVGAKGQMPYFEMRAGARYFAPIARSLFPARESQDWIDIERRDGPSATYVALESELSGAVPIAGGGPFWMLTAYYVSDLPDGYHLFEESLKVVIDPPWVWRFRVGYAARFGKYDAISLGVAQENLVLPGRGRHVLRAGLIASVRVTDNLDAQLSILPVLHGPDTIGLDGADFGQLGVRWRFATGMPKQPPSF
ncbi:MAG: hypothetical protein KF718_04525 [Polyangiaceae bacterium]|nr:hypothetical protein [Polyangiaceae bacterium]